MATYYDITSEELESFLTSLDEARDTKTVGAFKAMDLGDGTKELVYGRVHVHNDARFSLRIYTGINPDGHSREVGKDAIRVKVFWRDAEGNVFMCGSQKRVHRVKGWKKNLTNRLDNWSALLGPTCGCGAPTLERVNRTDNSKFPGCCTYRLTKCPRGTENWDGGAL